MKDLNKKSYPKLSANLFLAKWIVLFVLFVFSFSCKNKKGKPSEEIMVFCASSLTDVISDIINEFEKENNVAVNLNLASSGTLARQIENGADPDIFISANKSWLDHLLNKDLVNKEYSRRIAGNQMVLIAPKESNLQPFIYSEELNLSGLFEGRLSVGDPKHVPAGAYAVQLLEKMSCLTELESRFLPAKDARSALMVVELGEVDAGIVYKTDALKSSKVKIITTFPDSLHNTIDYYMAVTKESRNIGSHQLYNYIVSEKMIPVWEKYGFKR